MTKKKLKLIEAVPNVYYGTALRGDNPEQTTSEITIETNTRICSGKSSSVFLGSCESTNLKDKYKLKKKDFIYINNNNNMNVNEDLENNNIDIINVGNTQNLLSPEVIDDIYKTDEEVSVVVGDKKKNELVPLNVPLPDDHDDIRHKGYTLTETKEYFLLSNKKLYNDNLMERREYKYFVTLPHTDINFKSLFKYLKSKLKSVKYLLVCEEDHEEAKFNYKQHIHFMLESKNQVTVRTLHKHIKNHCEQQKKVILGGIKYEKLKSHIKGNQYIKKDGKFEEFGEASKPVKTMVDTIQENKNIILSSIELAEEGKLEEAKQLLKEGAPLEYLKLFSTLETTFEKMYHKKKTLGFEPPPNEILTTPYLWQTHLIGILECMPMKRRIIWVCGGPKTGKSTFFSYLHTNYDKGVCSMGAELDPSNLGHLYNGEGVICWDFPKEYFGHNDLEEIDRKLSNALETFSNFGGYITTGKYNGKTTPIKGHCVVFTNRLTPPEGIKHKTILKIYTDEKVQDHKSNTNNYFKPSDDLENTIITNNNKIEIINDYDPMYHNNE